MHEKQISITPQNRRVFSVVYNPRIRGEGNRKLTEVTGWNDPDLLTSRYIQDLHDVSHGYVNYEISEQIEVDRFPVNADGFVYDGDEYMSCIRNRRGFHQPDGTDYYRILADFAIIDRINRDTIDEVWLFAFPYAGFWESIMAGPGAFWCNAPELTSTAYAQRRFVVMGFSYERGVGEMLENLGHRAESIIGRVFRNQEDKTNLWEKFTRYDKTHPGQAEAGNVHFAPNSFRDYDWGNSRRVPSRYHTWKNFPDLRGEPRIVDASHWGWGDIRAHHLWWFNLMPHLEGSANEVSYNWWQYILDPNTVR